MNKADLIIIGAGPGGYKAAVYAAKKGLKVTIFEDVHVGGTCLNVGCIPTKTYVHSATFAEATERQPQVVEALRGGVETLLAHPNITLIREKGVFIDAHKASGEGPAPAERLYATFYQQNGQPFPGVVSENNAVGRDGRMGIIVLKHNTKIKVFV